MIKYKELREEKGLSQADIGKILGITSQAYGLIENGKRDASTEYLKTLSDFYNVTTDYMLGLSDDRHGKANLSDKLFLIPIVGKIPAGEPLLAEDNIIAYLPIDPLMYKLSSPDNLFFLQVVGDSMNNVVSEGTYVLIKKQNYAENGDIIAAIINGDDEATLKRFKQIDDMFVMLEPDSSNPIHMQRIINLKDTDFKIVGKVIGDFKKWN